MCQNFCNSKFQTGVYSVARRLERPGAGDDTGQVTKNSDAEERGPPGDRGEGGLHHLKTLTGRGAGRGQAGEFGRGPGRMEPVIIVHGGAGRLPEEDQEGRRAGCRGAASVGWQCLLQGGSALDAVEEAVVFLEDNPLFNAGKGSVLNAGGDVETDASLMEGRALHAGAVGAVRVVRNPIRLARCVLEDGQHVLLVGEGAERFARDLGIDVPALRPFAGWSFL